VGAAVRLVVNGSPYELEAEVAETLLDLLRERLGLTGTKRGCEKGDCGACTVLVNGEAVCACLVPALQAHGATILTIEGMAETPEFSAYEQAFLEAGAVQCGYCTPGMIMSAKALLDRSAAPTRTEIVEGISGNLCRCTGYAQIVKAIELVVARRVGGVDLPTADPDSESDPTRDA
jgi:carbon-monoxide dehydrogenase small subunit